MTAIARLTRAELRKLATTYAALVTLTIAIVLSVISVVANAATAGKNGTPALGTDASTYQMLKLGVVCCVAMLVLGIVAAGVSTGTGPSFRPCSSRPAAAPWSLPRPSPSPSPAWCWRA